MTYRPAQDLPLTTFSEILAGQLHPQFQYSFEYTVDNTDLISQMKTNSGSITQASGMGVASTGATTNSKAMLSGVQQARYKSGLGGVARFTVLFDDPVADTEQYIGLMDKHGSSAAFENGYVIGYDGTTFGFHRFQNDVKITTPIADWDDPLDEIGRSGAIINPKKLNVFYIRYEFLGGGKQEIWFEKQDGEKVLVHTNKYAGLNTEPSTHNPNFFIHMHVDNKSTTNNLVMKTSSFSYFVEGKTSFIELHQPVNSSGTIEKTSVTTEKAIYTIRNKSLYASKNNFIDALLLSIGVSSQASSANNLATIRIVKNATLGGTPSYNDINTTNSIMEIDTSGTSVTDGIELDSIELANKNDRDKINLINSKIILRPGDTLTVAGSSVNSATIRAGGPWRELF